MGACEHRTGQPSGSISVGPTGTDPRTAEHLTFIVDQVRDQEDLKRWQFILQPECVDGSASRFRFGCASDRIAVLANRRWSHLVLELVYRHAAWMMGAGPLEEVLTSCGMILDDA